MHTMNIFVHLWFYNVLVKGQKISWRFKHHGIITLQRTAIIKDFPVSEKSDSLLWPDLNYLGILKFLYILHNSFSSVNFLWVYKVYIKWTYFYLSHFLCIVILCHCYDSIRIRAHLTNFDQSAYLMDFTESTFS